MKIPGSLAVVLFLLLTELPVLSAADDVSVVLAPGPIWQRHTIDNTSKGADGVKLGDINRDGRPDIVTGWEEGGEVRVYLNPGPDHSREPWPRVTVGKVRGAEDAVFADLDGDGQLDVVSCTEGKTRTVFRHRLRDDSRNVMDAESWQTNAFPVTRNSQWWMFAEPMDLDGQYGVDLLLASKNQSGAVGWLQAPKSASDLGDWTYHALRKAGWVMSLTPSDMDGDGDPDVVFSDRKGSRTGVFWLQNPGAEANRQHTAWTEHPIGAMGREAMFLDLADINGDHLPDVAIAVKPVEIVLCLRQPDGGWKERSIPLNSSALGDAKAVKAADINGDGLTDLFFTCENAKGRLEGIVWLEQQRDGPWKQHSLGGPEGLKYDLMQALDLDDDGDIDVITCEERDQLGVIWYENPLGARQ